MSLDALVPAPWQSADMTLWDESEARSLRGDDLVVQSSDMALLNIASLASSGSLDLSPRYQRRSRWDRQKQSQLIESFLLNVPVPPVYLAEEARGVFAVIDGKQRLTAIADYFNDYFRLSKLSLRPELEGRTFSELDPISSSTLSMRPLRAVMVMRQTPDWVKHEVFLRLNTGGQPLNAQEIRNVAFAGQLNDQIMALASAEFLAQQLKIAGPTSGAFADMSDVEFVLRFFAVAEYWRDFGGDLRRAMDRFMIENREVGPGRIDHLSTRFLRALNWCQYIWQDLAFRRFDGRQWRDQMIGGVYDAQMVAVDALNDKLLGKIAERPTRAVEAMADLFGDDAFDSAVRQSTNTSARVRLRVDAVIHLLSERLNH